MLFNGRLIDWLGKRCFYFFSVFFLLENYLIRFCLDFWCNPIDLTFLGEWKKSKGHRFCDMCTASYIKSSSPHRYRTANHMDTMFSFVFFLEEATLEKKRFIKTDIDVKNITWPHSRGIHSNLAGICYNFIIEKIRHKKNKQDKKNWLNNLRERSTRSRHSLNKTAAFVSPNTKRIHKKNNVLRLPCTGYEINTSSNVMKMKFYSKQSFCFFLSTFMSLQQMDNGPQSWPTRWTLSALQTCKGQWIKLAGESRDRPREPSASTCCSPAHAAAPPPRFVAVVSAENPAQTAIPAENNAVSLPDYSSSYCRSTLRWKTQPRSETEYGSDDQPVQPVQPVQTEWTDFPIRLPAQNHPVERPPALRTRSQLVLRGHRWQNSAQIPREKWAEFGRVRRSVYHLASSLYCTEISDHPLRCSNSRKSRPEKSSKSPKKSPERSWKVKWHFSDVFLDMPF